MKYLTLLLLCLGAIAPLHAATIRVNSTADNFAVDGQVSLREAIVASNLSGTTELGDTGTGVDTIVFTGPAFDTPQTITLTSPLPDIQRSTSIQGSEAGVTISGAGQFQIFRIRAGQQSPPVPPIAGVRGIVVPPIIISNLTITNGLARGSDGGGGGPNNGGGGGGGAGMGGGIMIENQLVTLDHVTITNCTAQGGNGANGGTSFSGGLGGNGSFGGGAPVGTLVAGYSGGGFGGDSEINSGNGGNGGFGGGGGGGWHLSDSAGLGGAYGGHGGASDSNAASAGGGGGAGMGGAIFVRSGALTITGCTFTNSHAVGGNPGGGNNSAFAATGGQGLGGALFIDSQALTTTILNSTFDTGDATGTIGQGGCIFNLGQAMLTGVTIRNFTAGAVGNLADNSGGGIYNNNWLTLTRCVFDSNKSGSDDADSHPKGSAVANVGQGSSVVATETTFINNAGSGPYGGAVYVGGNTANFGSCYFSNNTSANSLGANGTGGAMSCTNTNNPVSLTNTTFFNNNASDGSALFLDGGYAELLNCTISEAGSSGLAFNSGGFQMFSCIMDANFKNLNVESPSTIGSATYTLLRSLSAGDRTVTDNSHNIIATTAQMLLSAPGNYGGSVKTIGLLPGSPAIDSATGAGAPLTDARGVTRPKGAGYDRGAFESQGFTLAISGGNNQSAQVNTAFAQPLQVTLTSLDGIPVGGVPVNYVAPDVGASSTFAPSSTVPITGTTAQVTATANGTAGAYSVTASVAGVTPVSFNLTNVAAPVILPPVIISTMSSPNPARPGELVTLTVVATDPQNLPLTYFYVYGDGTSGASNLHIYNAPGSYTATVTVSNGFLTASAPIQVIVIVVPGNNFRFTLHTLSKATDNVTIQGVIHIPSNFSFAGKTFTLDIGGNSESFVLDAKGRGTNAHGKISIVVRKRGGVTDSNEDVFTAVFKGVNFAEKLKQNLPLDGQGLPQFVRVTVTLDTIILVSTGKTRFRLNSVGFGGLASYPPRR